MSACRIGNGIPSLFDLVRTNRAMEVINSKGFNLTKDKLLFPIPVNAIDINPGLLQNPGY